MVFEDPSAIMLRLWGPDGRTFVQGLWRETGWSAARASDRWRNRPDDGSGKKQLLQEAQEPGETLGPVDKSDELDVIKCRTSAGELMTIVRLPSTWIFGEALFVAIVLPDLDSLRHDPAVARKVATFFVLSRWSGKRDTDLTGWTGGGEERFYNCGAPLDPPELARLLESKIRRTWHIEKKPR